MEFSYIFVEYQKKVTMCSIRNGKVEFIKPNGEQWVSIERDYFEIWEKKVGHNDEPVDFCIISDAPISLKTAKFKYVENTFYTMDIVKKCLLEIFGQSSIILFNEERIQININSIECEFKCNLNLLDRICEDETSSEEVSELNVEGLEKKILLRHYIEKTKKYNK